MGKEPREIIVKTLVTIKDIKTTFEFFTNLQNWESGGSLKNIKKNRDNWWSADSPFGNVKIKLRDNRKFGIFDHDFNAGDVNWTVFCRVTPNETGSAVSWLFIRPENMSHEQFEKQMDNFDDEITGWKQVLELS